MYISYIRKPARQAMVRAYVRACVRACVTHFGNRYRGNEATPVCAHRRA